MPDIFECALSNNTVELTNLLAANRTLANLNFNGTTDCLAVIAANAAWYAKHTIGLGTIGFGALVGAIGIATGGIGAALIGLVASGVIGTVGAGITFGANEAIAPYTYTCRNWTPLHFAAVGNSIQAAILLIQSGADYTLTVDQKKFTDIAKEAENFHFVRYVIQFIQNHAYSLASFYETGTNGYAKNLALAAKYYRQALEYGSSRGQIELNRIFEDPNLSGYDANTIGIMYYSGQGVAVDYAKAKIWFEKAMSKGSSQGERNLGLIYHSGLGVPQDPFIASERYCGALEKGYPETDFQADYERLLAAHQPQARFLERRLAASLVNTRLQQPGGINKRDVHQMTLLGREAQRKQLKSFARLSLLGAQNEPSPGQQRPTSYLTPAELEQVNVLKIQLSELLSNLNTDASQVMAQHTSAINSSLTRDELRLAFQQMYLLPHIAPLIDLGKLCTLGLHNLSGRRKFTDSGYDSDEDASEQINEAKQNLTIIIDGRSRTVEGIAHYGHDGHRGVDALGVYLSTTKNTIYIGGQQLTTAEVRATVMHELTHFLAQEIFKNNCNPYLATDHSHAREFAAITNDLYARQSAIDPILNAVFRYQRLEWDREFIARVPQICLAYIDGVQRLTQQAPRLFAYYENVFLAAVKAHTDYLAKRALSFWPKALFDQVAATGSNVFGRIVP